MHLIIKVTSSQACLQQLLSPASQGEKFEQVAALQKGPRIFFADL